MAFKQRIAGILTSATIVLALMEPGVVAAAPATTGSANWAMLSAVGVTKDEFASLQKNNEVAAIVALLHNHTLTSEQVSVLVKSAIKHPPQQPSTGSLKSSPAQSSLASNINQYNAQRANGSVSMAPAAATSATLGDCWDTSPSPNGLYYMVESTSGYFTAAADMNLPTATLATSTRTTHSIYDMWGAVSPTGKEADVGSALTHEWSGGDLVRGQDGRLGVTGGAEGADGRGQAAQVRPGDGRGDADVVVGQAATPRRGTAEVGGKGNVRRRRRWPVRRRVAVGEVW